MIISFLQKYETYESISLCFNFWFWFWRHLLWLSHGLIVNLFAPGLTLILDFAVIYSVHVWRIIATLLCCFLTTLILVLYLNLWLLTLFTSSICMCISIHLFWNSLHIGILVYLCFTCKDMFDNYLSSPFTL